MQFYYQNELSRRVVQMGMCNMAWRLRYLASCLIIQSRTSQGNFTATILFHMPLPQGSQRSTLTLPRLLQEGSKHRSHIDEMSNEAARTIPSLEDLISQMKQAAEELSQHATEHPQSKLRPSEVKTSSGGSCPVAGSMLKGDGSVSEPLLPEKTTNNEAIHPLVNDSVRYPF